MNIQKFKAMPGKVLLEVEAFKLQSKGGFQMPQANNKDIVTAHVINAGETTEPHHTTFKGGEIVLVNEYIGKKIHENDKDYMIVSYNDILAVMEEDGKDS